MGGFVNRWGVWPFCKLSSCEGTQRYSKDFSSTFYIKWDIYSNVKAYGGLSYTSQVFGYEAIQGNLDRIPKSYSGTREKWSIVFSSTHHINWGLTFMLSSPEAWVIPALWTLGQFCETGPKIMSRDTQEVIENPLHIAN